MYTAFKNWLTCFWFGHESFTKPKWFKYTHYEDMDCNTHYYKVKYCKRCGIGKRVEFRDELDPVPQGAVRR